MRTNNGTDSIHLTIQHYLDEARHYAETHQPEKVGETLFEGTRRYPDSVELLSHYAYFCYKTGRLIPAVDLMERRNTLVDPDQSNCLLLARFYRDLGDSERVSYWLKRAAAWGALTWKDRLRYGSSALIHRAKQVYRRWKNSSTGKAISNAWFQVCSNATITGVTFLERAFPVLFDLPKRRSPYPFSAFLRFLQRYDPAFLRSKLAYHKCREIIFATQCLPRNTDVSILDIGTGENPLALYWASLGYSVIALDGSLYGCHSLDQTQRKIEQHQGAVNFRYLVGDACRLPIADETLDLVTAICAIEHIPDEGDIQCIQEIYRVLKPGGKAVITVETGGVYSEAWMAVHYERGYQAGLERQGSSRSAWQSVFCRNYTLSEIQSRLLQPVRWGATEIGFFDDVNLPLRAWSDPLRHPILPVLMQPFLPLCSSVFYRKCGFTGRITPSSIGYIIAQKPKP